MPKKATKKTTKKKKYKSPMDTPGFAWRVGLSIISFFALIIFIIVWLFFHADMYTVYQNMAVIIVALLAFCGVMGGAWAPWGMKYGDDFEEC